MVAKKTVALTTAATFGAAMSSLFVAPELNADIVDLTFTPGSVGPQSTSVAVNIQIGPGVGSFSQWNDVFGVTMLFNGGLDSWRTAFASESLSGSTVSGVAGNINPLAATSNAFVAFSVGGNVGWFELSFDGTTVTFNDGEFGSEGEAVTVGGTTSNIPEPGFGALAALAIGAAGVRRNRKK